MALLARGRREPVAQAVADAQAQWSEPTPLGRQSLTAAATRVDLAAPRTKRKTEVDWQTEAWTHYNRCGELQYAAAWMANSLARIRIYAAEVGEDGRPGKPTDNAQAKSIAHALFGGPGAASQMMSALGVHLTVPGDCYIVSEERPDKKNDDWFVVSTSELKKKSGKLGIDRDGTWRALDPQTSILIRIWNPHPQRHDEATSATRAVLPVLRELQKLDDHVYATLESRLPAGILFVPDNVDFLAPDPEQQAALGSTNGLMTLLAEVMLAAVEDSASPAALVPIIAKIPAEAMNKIQHITFGSDLINAVGTMRDACIRRLALGLDMPPEQLLGLGDSSHWSSWQIEEGGVKVHVEPKAITIVSALTETYFRPALAAAGVKNVENFVLWYDVTDLILRPNRSDAAKELHGDHVLSEDVLMREAGFNPETDKPTPEQYKRRILEELLFKEPLFAQPILKELGIDIELPILAPLTRAIEIGPDGEPEKPQVGMPGKGGPPVDDEPKGQDSPAQKGGGGGQGKGESPEAKSDRQTKASLGIGQGGAQFAAYDPWALAREVAVESLVSRGLEYANKKLLTRGRRGTFDGDIRRFYIDGGITVSRDQVARLIDGAWAYLPEIAASVRLDPVVLEEALTDHVCGLLVTGQEHQRQYSRTIATASVLTLADADAA